METDEGGSMSVKEKAVDALRKRLVAVLGGTGKRLDAEGRTSHFEENVVASIEAQQVKRLRHQLESGDGGELKTGPRGARPKFNSAHSSSALALNAFGAWLGREDSLNLCGLEAPGAALRLEAQQRIFRGGRAPNLDCLLSGGQRVIGIESKLTEPLTVHHPGTWSEAYARPECRALLSGGWSELLEEYVGDTAAAGRLDVSQLVKHALGLRSQNPEKDVHLVYVYWEPEDAEDFAEFRSHRAEVARLADRVGDTPPHFHAISYPDLFRAWTEEDAEPWVSAHVDCLRARYSVALR
jgi:hypothetical protein